MGSQMTLTLNQFHLSRDKISDNWRIVLKEPKGWRQEKVAVLLFLSLGVVLYFLSAPSFNSLNRSPVPTDLVSYLASPLPLRPGTLLEPSSSSLNTVYQQSFHSALVSTSTAGADLASLLYGNLVTSSLLDKHVVCILSSSYRRRSILTEDSKVFKILWVWIALFTKSPRSDIDFVPFDPTFRVLPCVSKILLLESKLYFFCLL
jgi:hypothetical protein